MACDLQKFRQMAEDAQVLDQNEIDALLRAAPRAPVHGTGGSAPRSDAQPVPFDFSRPDVWAQGRMPALDKVGDRLVRSLRSALFTLLRRMGDVSRKAITLERFGSYAASLAVPSSLNIARFAPLPGKGLIVLQPELVFAGLDMLFGGKGRQARLEQREFTAIENRVIELLLRHSCDCLADAWAPVTRIAVEPIGMEVNPRFAAIVAPDETVVIMRLRIVLESGAGELHVVMPNAMLQPVREQLAAEPAPRTGRDPAWAKAVQRELGDVPVEVRTLMGSVSVSLAQFARLAPGDVLDCNFSGIATLQVEGIPVRRGTLAQLRGRQVIRIESRD
jgi:flagellar motor switch protein FliM